MKTAKWCNENLNSSPLTVKEIKQEIIEVFESKTLTEFKDEVSDVLYMSYCALESKTGINLSMLGASKTVNKIQTRLHTWKQIFIENNLIFNKKYLINGSNFNKSEKVKKALELAKQDQVRSDTY